MATASIVLSSCGSMLEMAGPDAVTPNTGTPVTPGGGNGNTGNPGNIKGTWQFVDISVESSTNMSAVGTKISSYMKYTTSNNGGSIVIDDANIAGKDLTYSVVADVRVTISAPVIGDEVTNMPVAMKMDPYSASSPYRLAGKDSIYIAEGMMHAPQGSGIADIPSFGGRGKYWMSGDTLCISLYSAGSIAGEMGPTAFTATQLMKAVKSK
ncbi:hypothetical protein [Chitinophaga sp. 212800010-3]|uniref:hypothetical protein n=1 Tax=unclassified Chitinophaga TaxID=2619133 RepID=UPI002DE4A06B|nr:hypothetical protein [Chitinophaga sp. 212800010-3]